MSFGDFRLKFLVSTCVWLGMAQIDFWKTHPGQFFNMDEFSRNRFESSLGKLKLWMRFPGFGSKGEESEQTRFLLESFWSKMTILVWIILSRSGLRNAWFIFMIQVTDMMVANAANLIITVKPASQKNNIQKNYKADPKYPVNYSYFYFL